MSCWINSVLMSVLVLEIGASVLVKPDIKIFHISRNSWESGSEVEFNGTELIIREQVELVCNASFPIKWEYIYKGKAVGVVEVRYFRHLQKEARKIGDLKEPANNGFEGRLRLRGPLESQSGKYVCRYYNGRLTNNSYEAASFIHIFVPGNRTFNEVTHVKFINKTDAFLLIPCPVTDPNIHVRLFKLNDNLYNKTGEHRWKSIYGNYSAREGFHVEGGLGRSLLGDYNCSADNGNSLRLQIQDISAKPQYELDGVNGESCWENEGFLRLIRSKRLECFCQDSYALFVNADSLEEENRKGSCTSNSSHNSFLQILKQNCSDWRLEQFFGNQEESHSICFRDGVRDMFNGTGTRFILRAKGKETDPPNPWMRNVKVIYDGLPSWAAGFKLAYEILHNGTSTLEIIPQEPKMTRLYPLAHYTAVWDDLMVDLREVKKIHVFQPDSFSFQWFQVSKPIPNIVKQESGVNSTSTTFSSAHNIPITKYNLLYSLFILILCTYNN